MNYIIYTGKRSLILIFNYKRPLISPNLFIVSLGKIYNYPAGGDDEQKEFYYTSGGFLKNFVDYDYSRDYEDLECDIMTLDSDKWDWRYRASGTGSREQKRLYYSPHGDSTCGEEDYSHFWAYYLLGSGGEQLAVYEGQQTSAEFSGQSGRRVYMRPVSYLTNGGELITRPDSALQYSISDNLGSVRSVVTFCLNGDTLRSINSFDYKPYGDTLNQSTEEPRLSYKNNERDIESRYIAMGARQYDPVTGRFLSVDPLFESFRDLTPYHYAYNSPMTWRDPSGLAPEKEKMKDKIQWAEVDINSESHDYINIVDDNLEEYVEASRERFNSWGNGRVETIINSSFIHILAREAYDAITSNGSSGGGRFDLESLKEDVFGDIFKRDKFLESFGIEDHHKSEREGKDGGKVENGIDQFFPGGEIPAYPNEKFCGCISDTYIGGDESSKSIHEYAPLCFITDEVNVSVPKPSADEKLDPEIALKMHKEGAEYVNDEELKVMGQDLRMFDYSGPLTEVGLGFASYLVGKYGGKASPYGAALGVYLTTVKTMNDIGSIRNHNNWARAINAYESLGNGRGIFIKDNWSMFSHTMEIYDGYSGKMLGRMFFHIDRRR